MSTFEQAMDVDGAAAAAIEAIVPDTREPKIKVQVDAGYVLDARAFTLHEHVSELPTATAMVRSKNHNIDFDLVVGKPATLTVRETKTVTRRFSGICSQIHQTQTAKHGHSTYQLTIVPPLWLATQRRNHRMFQQLSEPEIVLRILGEWKIAPREHFDRGAYPKRKYRVQYGESDFAFVCRMLEDVGIAFFFDASGTLVLSDEPHRNTPRADVRYDQDISGTLGVISDLELGKQVRSGKYTIRDHDYRRGAGFVLEADATTKDPTTDPRLERFHYVPGAFLFGAEAGGETPTADDRGAARHDPDEGSRVAKLRLEAKRGSAEYLAFSSTSFDLRVGDVMRIVDHPNDALGKPVLVLATAISGSVDRASTMQCEATFADKPYRPPLTVPKPHARGVESATVVGPAGQEIHTDEFGRVRVHFHWDRESKRDESSSCWIHVSQGWAGTGYGAINIPRVGQEVIVDFLGGDPDRPVIVGRVYTSVQPVPYTLPANKTKSGWRSHSTPGGGGYNEIMFEDKKGSELLSMHAQRDMATLVEHDQSLDVRHDRTKRIVRDETVRVGRNRAEEVGDSETISVARDRTRTVGANESLAVGASRSRRVGEDETIAIGRDRTRTVGNDDTLFVGGVVTRIYTDRWCTIRGDSFGTVGHDVHETVLHDRVRSVLHDDTCVIGNDVARSVGGSSTLAIDKESTIVVGGGAKRQVGTDDVLAVGGSQSVEVAESQSTRVGADAAIEVGASMVETVGAAKSSTVAGPCSLAVGASMVATVARESTERVGTLKEVVANDAIHLESGLAIVRVRENGEILIGRGGLDLPHATLRIEEREDLTRRLVIGFGKSRLALGMDGTVEIEGSGLAFNGAAMEGAPVVLPWPPMPPVRK